MKVADTTYGKEILEGVRKSRRRYIRMVIVLNLIIVATVAGLGGLYYVMDVLSEVMKEKWILPFIGGIEGVLLVLLGVALWKTPERILDKLINKRLKTEEKKRLFLEQLNQKPAGVLKLTKKCGKVVFTNDFLVYYNEDSATYLNVTIMRLQDMDQVEIKACQGIVSSYTHKYRKRNHGNCVQSITFTRKSDSNAFLNWVRMLRPQLEISK